MNPAELTLSFYDENYEILNWWQLTPGEKISLGDRNSRVCRFCGRTKPEVTFQNEAHVIPELLGNKSLFSFYECDCCNKFFGANIENHFGNWSKPMRTLQRIRGKRGVPTLKNDGDGWRIECDDDRQFRINHDLADSEFTSVFSVYEKEKRVNFLLNRDPHIPMAVLKTFVKIGISLMPDAEIPNFYEALQWIRNPLHKIEFELIAPVHRTFNPGPVNPDLITVAILKRKVSNKDLPYAFLILTVGNETFQVMLPSPLNDPLPSGQSRSIPPFTDVRSAQTSFGAVIKDRLDLSGDILVTDEKISVDMQFEQVAVKTL